MCFAFSLFLPKTYCFYKLTHKKIIKNNVKCLGNDVNERDNIERKKINFSYLLAKKLGEGLRWMYVVPEGFSLNVVNTTIDFLWD